MSSRGGKPPHALEPDRRSPGQPSQAVASPHSGHACLRPLKYCCFYLRLLRLLFKPVTQHRHRTLRTAHISQSFFSDLAVALHAQLIPGCHQRGRCSLFFAAALALLRA